MATTRRTLNFENLNQVKEELQRLLADGYRQQGNWNLAQTCAHLNDWMRYLLDGYPQAPAPIRAVLWLMKITIGRRQLRQVLGKGFKDKLPTMPDTVYPPGNTSDEAAAAELTETINRLQASGGNIAESHISGTLTYDQAVQLQLAHCAHHLAFLVPNSEPTA